MGSTSESTLQTADHTPAGSFATTQRKFVRNERKLAIGRGVSALTRNERQSQHCDNDNKERKEMIWLRVPRNWSNPSKAMMDTAGHSRCFRRWIGTNLIPRNPRPLSTDQRSPITTTRQLHGRSFSSSSFGCGSFPSNKERQLPTQRQPSLLPQSSLRPSHTTRTTTPISQRWASSETSNNAAALQDEYGAMDDSGDSYTAQQFVLENGSVLPEATLRYQTYGTLNEQRDNVIVICHALTGNASVHAWWGDLLGPDKAFDTSRYYIVCANILGSCYGSTSPQSADASTGEPYGDSFPDISVQDTVRLQLKLLREHLNISSIAAVIGGSFGGMQAVEYVVQCHLDANESSSDSDSDDDDDDSRPFLRAAIPIACGSAHTAWQTGVSHVQRVCVQKWGVAGLDVARQMAMLSYRTPLGYSTKFGRNQQNDATASYGPKAKWAVESYLNYQGTKFLDRFDPITYTKLTEQMDSHDIYRGRSSDILRHIQIPVLVLGIDSDILYPLAEQEALVEAMGSNATLGVIHSPDGHDGFLLEQEQVGGYITQFLKEQREREEKE